MSRTYKDRPYKLKYDAWDKDRESYKYTAVWLSIYGDYREHEFTAFLQTKTTKPKKRKEVDTENHWMTTPSWFNNLFHTRKHRGNFRTFLNSAVKSKVEDIDDMLEPLESNKPHIYYW